jgi:hypothetical protein
MAIHTLPNGSIWDTNLDWENQSTGSMEFWDAINRNIDYVAIESETTRNPNMARPLKTTRTETQYSGSNYVVTTIYSYMSTPGSVNCFAQRGSSTTREITEK